MSPLHRLPIRRACSLAALFGAVACSPETSRDPVAPTLPALSAASVALPLNGTVEAFMTAVYPPGTNSALIHEEGTGTATHLGRFTWVNDLTLDLATFTGTARSTLTAANGDVLTTIMATRGIPNGDGTINTLESATITGGTGRFTGATGGYNLRRVLIEATGALSGSFDGTITPEK